jgi:hypothetical protein
MPGDPSPVAVGERFEMSPGSSVAVSAADLVIVFDRVVTDSRCPADAICITAGDAELAFRLGRDGRTPGPVTLNAESPGNRLTSGEWVLVVVALQPYPLSSRPISPGDYRVTLLVDRSAEPAR